MISKHLKLFILTSLILLVMPGVTSAQSMKIGVVDMLDIRERSSSFKAAQNQVQSQFEGRTKALQNQEQELARLQSDLQRNAATLSQQAKQGKEKEFQDKVKKYRDDVNNLVQSREAKMKEVFTPLLNRLEQVIRDYASKNGFTLVLEKAVVLYPSDANNITPQILQAFDRR